MDCAESDATTTEKTTTVKSPEYEITFYVRRPPRYELMALTTVEWTFLPRIGEQVNLDFVHNSVDYEFGGCVGNVVYSATAETDGCVVIHIELDGEPSTQGVSEELATSWTDLQDEHSGMQARQKRRDQMTSEEMRAWMGISEETARDLVCNIVVAFPAIRDLIVEQTKRRVLHVVPPRHR